MSANYTYTDEEMLAALRSVAAALGSRQLSGPKYEQHRPKDAPRRNAILVRFGTWREAIERAGLQSPTIKGGLQIPCVICGALFRGDRGKKARRTCSPKCEKTLAVECRVNAKGDESTPQAARGRARRRVVVQSCELCGCNASTRRLEVHHRDRNPYNNAPSNLQVLCIPCHKESHREGKP